MGFRLDGLRSAPEIYVAGLVDAAHGAIRRAGFLGEELALDVRYGVVGDGDAGEAALLRAVVHEAVLADAEVARARAAAPLVGNAAGDVLLELIDLRVAALAEFF